MQLYDEFNDKLCEINEHLGDIYTYRDLQDVKEAEKERERSLLREAIKELQKEIERLQNIKRKDIQDLIDNEKENIYKNYISKDKIKERKKWYEDTCEHLSKNGIDLDKYDQYQGAIELCEELLEEK
jgi:predicted ribosome quality control (RQC) complex YloA/Tae2 family protein